MNALYALVGYVAGIIAMVTLSMYTAEKPFHARAADCYAEFRVNRFEQMLKDLQGAGPNHLVWGDVETLIHGHVFKCVLETYEQD